MPASPRLLLLAILLASNKSSAAKPLPDGLQNAVCVIEFADGSGTGFITTFRGKPVVATNQHVVLGKEGLKISNSQGKIFRPAGGALAVNCDVALLFLTDPLPEGVTPFKLSENVATVAKDGDEVVIVGNSLGNGTLTNTAGKIKSVGPNKVEHDVPTFHGNSGSPIFHERSGTVIGIDTESVSALSGADWADKSSAKKEGASVKGDGVRLFGHRLDTESKWIPLDWRTTKATQTQLDRIEDLLLDSLLVLDSGSYSAIKDDVMRSQFTDVAEKFAGGKSSETEAYNLFMKAIDSVSSSIEFKIKQLEAQTKGYHQLAILSEHKKAAKIVREALNVLKGELALAKAIYAGKYKMPERIKALLYPNGTVIFFKE